MNQELSIDDKFKGFTTIELVVTIIILGILAASIVPRILESNGFEEHTYRNEVITKLRLLQLRAMQQTDGNHCTTVSLGNKSLFLFATNEPPTTPVCSNSAEAGEITREITRVDIATSHNVAFSYSENLTQFSFSQLGKPLGCIAVNPCEISITVTGQDALTITINSEGYIYAS